GRLARLVQPGIRRLARARQSSAAGGRDHRGEGEGLLGMADGEDLRDRTAVRTADNMRRLDAEGVQKAGGVVRHVLQRVGGLHLLLGACGREGALDVGRSPVVELRREAGIPVVEGDDAETPAGEAVDHALRPADQLRPEAADHKDDLAVLRAVGFVFDLDSVGICLRHLGFPPGLWGQTLLWSEHSRNHRTAPSGAGKEWDMSRLKLDTDKMIAEVEDGIGWVVFNNPERRNAVSVEMQQALPVIFEAFQKDDAVRVVVMRGAGDKAFVSGADISQFEERRASPEAVAEYERMGERSTEAMLALDKPLIAMIRGFCMG